MTATTDNSVPSKPMTITIQYKIYPDSQGQPQTVAVKRDLADLINEAPPEAAQGTMVPPVTAPTPTAQNTPIATVAPATELKTSKVPPIPVNPLESMFNKEMHTVITPAGQKFEIPTIVTHGYDLDQLVCTLCNPNKTFKNDKTLMGHMLGHFGVAPKMAKCPICGLTLQKKSYARHLRLHGNVVPENCPYCQKGFRERRSLDKHIRAIHHADRPFSCDYCDEKFRNQVRIASCIFGVRHSNFTVHSRSSRRPTSTGISEITRTNVTFVV